MRYKNGWCRFVSKSSVYTKEDWNKRETVQWENVIGMYTNELNTKVNFFTHL